MKYRVSMLVTVPDEWADSDVEVFLEEAVDAWDNQKHEGVEISDYVDVYEV